jgi:SHS2 domain-containing protein
MGRYEILEHTADIGIRAHGDSLEECFEQAAEGLIAIIGIARHGRGERVMIELSSHDLPGLLVDWLSEVLYLHDARDAVVVAVEVHSVSAADLKGAVTLAPRADDPIEGIQVKAITYHQLKVEQTPAGFVAEVYFDV